MGISLWSVPREMGDQNDGHLSDRRGREFQGGEGAGPILHCPVAWRGEAGEAAGFGCPISASHLSPLQFGALTYKLGQVPIRGTSTCAEGTRAGEEKMVYY